MYFIFSITCFFRTVETSRSIIDHLFLCFVQMTQNSSKRCIEVYIEGKRQHMAIRSVFINIFARARRTFGLFQSYWLIGVLADILYLKLYCVVSLPCCLATTEIFGRHAYLSVQIRTISVKKQKPLSTDYNS